MTTMLLMGAGVGAPAGTPLSLTYLGDDGVAPGGSTVTFSSKSLGAATADRRIVVGVVGLHTGASHSISSLTVGGQTASSLVNVVNSTSIASLWLASVSSGTTGDIVVTCSTTFDRAVGIGWWRLVDGTGDTTAHDTDSDTTGSTIGNDIDVPANGGVIAIYGDRQGSPATSASWSNVTERYDDGCDESTTGMKTGGDEEYATLQTALQVRATISGSQTDPVFVAASFD